jgi:ferredoxin
MEVLQKAFEKDGLEEFGLCGGELGCHTCRVNVI